jgi:hypothetical protein
MPTAPGQERQGGYQRYSGNRLPTPELHGSRTPPNTWHEPHGPELAGGD